MNADTIPKERKHLWCLLTDEEHRELKRLALKLNADLEQLVTEILREAIANQEEK